MSSGENNLTGSISETELLPGADSNGSGQDDGGLEGGDDIFGDTNDDDFLNDNSGGEEFSDQDLFGNGNEFGGDDLGGDSDDEFLENETGSGNRMAMQDSGGANYSSEIESRVNEMENEVGSLSSTVNTVQSENEQISESLEEIEQNIRQLLEVYEMVTQGVNPFVEGDSLSDTFNQESGTGNFGGQSLFDSDGDTNESTEEEIDDDITSTEAEAFLDEDIIDDGLDDDFEDDFDDLDEDEGVDDTEDTASDGELSFDELKAEYESGDAEWDESTNDEAEEDALENEGTEEDFEAGGFDEDLENGSADEFDDEVLDDPVSTADVGSPTEDVADTDALDGAGTTKPETSPPFPWDDGGRPYLECVPSEYDTEFIVMDWLDYLVAEAGIDGAAQTIELYGSLGWIGDPVCSYLKRLLNGFDGGPKVEGLDAESSLGIDHARSLWWIEQIATPAKRQPPYDDWLEKKVASRVGTPEAAADEIPTELTYADRTASGLESENDPFKLDSETDAASGTQRDAGAHKIAIEETTDDETTEVPQATVNTDGDGMIWVDSDIVLSESGVELRTSQEGSDGDRIGQESPMVTTQETKFEWAGKSVKPLLDPNDEDTLEPWKLELVQSLFSPDSRAHR